MTRVNLVDPSELSRLHLIAEYKEITRIPGNLKRSLKRKSKPFSLSEIPPHFVLGPGHVKFFYDKMKFLRNRYQSLVDEMESRGYTVNFKDLSIFEDCPQGFFNDYEPTPEAVEASKIRILERS